MNTPADNAAVLRKDLLRGQKVLIVEDEYLQADSHCRLLRNAGATVVGPFAGVEDSIAAISLQAPTLAIIDLKLSSGQMAYDILDCLLGAGIPFVVITGYDCSSLPMAYRGLHCLTKPAMSIDVIDALRKALEGDVACAEGSGDLWQGEPTPI